MTDRGLLDLHRDKTSPRSWQAGRSTPSRAHYPNWVLAVATPTCSSYSPFTVAEANVDPSSVSTLTYVQGLPISEVSQSASHCARNLQYNQIHLQYRLLKFDELRNSTPGFYPPVEAKTGLLVPRLWPSTAPRHDFFVISP